MSTNATATFHNEHDDKPFCKIYKHWDGYPEGFGKELKDLATGYRVENGIPMDVPSNFANGMGCLAAQIVAQIKDHAGDVYLVSVDDADEEYNYHVRLTDGKVQVTCDEEEIPD